MTEQEPRYGELESLCPQPCVHLSAEDSREGKECPEHPCICSQIEIRERKALTLAGLDYWARNATNPSIREDCARARDLIIDLAARKHPEPEWEYGAGYEADNGREMRWFSMGGAAYTVREAAENEVARLDDPQVRLVRRAKPGPWTPVEGEAR